MEDIAKKREQEITKVTLVGSLVNLLLTIFKLLAGIFGKSAAMVADGIHSASDFVTDIIVVIFVHISSKGNDHDHDFGHGKFETMATLIVSLMLFTVGVELLVGGLGSISDILNGKKVASPSYIALVAALLSIVSKELLFHYTVRVARKVDSSVVEANAWHHRSDSFSSIGSLIGIGGAIILGSKWSLLDPLAGCVISVMIMWVAIRISIPALNDLVDKSLPDEIEDRICSLAESIQGVNGLHSLKTRHNGREIAMEAHLVLDAEMSVKDAHDIATLVEKAIRGYFGEATQISLHIEPDESAE